MGVTHLKGPAIWIELSPLLHTNPLIIPTSESYGGLPATDATVKVPQTYKE